jgi:hypothetical protein
MQYRLTFALLAASATTILAAPVSADANVAKYADYGVYPDQPPSKYTTYAPPKDGYGSYGKEDSGKKVTRSAEDYGKEQSNFFL